MSLSVLTNAYQQTFVGVRFDRDKVRLDDGEFVAVNREDKSRVDRCVNETKQVTDTLCGSKEHQLCLN